MDDRVFNLLFQKVCRVVEALEPFTIQSAEIQRMWYGPRGFFLLTPEGPGRYSELVRHALRHGTWNERFSPEYVSRRLRDIIERHVTEGQENAREALRALVAQLDAYHEEHTVYVPVYGIDIPDAPTRTIGNLTLHQSTNAFLDTITDKDSFDRSYVQRHTDAHVWAEVRVIAEPTHAVTRAEEQCTPLIDLLRFWNGQHDTKQHPLRHRAARGCRHQRTTAHRYQQHDRRKEVRPAPVTTPPGILPNQRRHYEYPTLAARLTCGTHHDPTRTADTIP